MPMLHCWENFYAKVFSELFLGKSNYPTEAFDLHVSYILPSTVRIPFLIFLSPYQVHMQDPVYYT